MFIPEYDSAHGVSEHLDTLTETISDATDLLLEYFMTTRVIL